MGEIWAIVLAAGESKRMKVPKMLLPFNGKTMVEMVIGNIKSSEVFNILVVLGSFRDEILNAVYNLNVNYCFNENYRSGMLSSVKCGFNNLPASCGACLVFPGDQPFIEKEVINSMIRAYRKTGKGIIYPVYRKRRGHPLLVDLRYREEINALTETETLRALSCKFPEDIMEVKTSSQGVLKDIDTKQDYLNEINR
jgi:molybdenum cofactor cytidylyltransferase